MKDHKNLSLHEKIQQHKQGLALSVQDQYNVSEELTQALLSSEHFENAFGMNGYKTRSSQRASSSEQMPDEDSSDLAYAVMNCATGVYY